MNKRKTEMLIGEVAKLTHISIQTIRYYEQIGLIKPLMRKSSGYRIYNQNALKTLRFVKQAQELGFTLVEIKMLLSLKASDKSKCEAVQVRASKHLEDVEGRIAKLVKIREVLSETIVRCKKRKIESECPLLDCLDWDD